MTTLTTPILLGKLSHQNEANITFFSLPCSKDKSFKLDCILLDKDGRSIWERPLIKAKGQTMIKFQINNLKNGHYHFWIEIEGKTKMQPVFISKPPKGRLQQLLKKYFK